MQPFLRCGTHCFCNPTCRSFTFHFSFMGNAVFGKAQHVPFATVATRCADQSPTDQTAKWPGGQAAGRPSDLLTSPTRLCPVLAVADSHRRNLVQLCRLHKRALHLAPSAEIATNCCLSHKSVRNMLRQEQ